MKQIDRYILRSFAGPFVATFFISAFVLLMQLLWQLLDDLVGKGIETKVLLELLYYTLIGLIPMALPLAILLGSIMTFGNLGEKYELIAFKAAGISLLRIMRPIGILVAFLSVGLYYLQNYVVTDTQVKFYALVQSIKKQRPDLIVSEGMFSNEVDGFSIKVGEKDDERQILYDIMVYDHRDGKRNQSVTVADSGKLVTSEDKEHMILTMYHGQTHVEEKEKNRRKKRYPFRSDTFEKRVITIPVKGFNRNNYDERNYRNRYKTMPNELLRSTIDSLHVREVTKEKKVVVSASYNGELNMSLLNYYQPDSLKKEFPEMAKDTVIFDSIYASFNKVDKAAIYKTAIRAAQSSSRAIKQNSSELRRYQEITNRHYIEWHRKYVNSFLCILLFLIGTSLGAIIRKGGFGLPVVISILLFISNYVVGMIGEKIAREGVWHVWSGMWMASFIYFPIAIMLTYMAVTDSPIMSSDTYIRFFKKINIFSKFSKDSDS